jgi:DNA repair protein RecN (Recombination protein N)
LLVELKVKSFGIIENLLWSPDGGLNVITGETGAGKSLVVDAIKALFEGRLDEESIRYGADSARIEAVFSPDNDRLLAGLKILLEEKGVSAEDDGLVISCEFRRQGRSVIRINGSAVARGLLREVSGMLVDVHSQSEHLSLFNIKYHLDYLDAYAHCVDMKTELSEKVTRLYALEAEYDRLKKAAAERIHRQEILRYQNDEIIRARLDTGEERDLEQKRSINASCEKLKALAYEAYQVLNGDDGAGPVALSRLNEAVRSVHALVSLDPSLKPHAETLETALASVEEIARDLRSYEDKLEYDPRKMEEIENRLEIIRQMKKKYGGSVEQVLERQKEIESELALMDSASENELCLEQDITKLKNEIGLLAVQLSAKRRDGAARFEKAVEAELNELNMEQVRFKVSIRQMDDEEGIPFEGRMVGFNKEGADEVEFMVSTNPGEPMKPLAAIASTGEVSRFTLALKVALAEADSTPVLIFDEIDIGVGGRSGDVIGKKLWSLARHHQVICVTHLPQIAVFADAQYSVRKESSGGRRISAISVLDENGRNEELAVMLGGTPNSETSLKTAVDMLEKASKWKRMQIVSE